MPWFLWKMKHTQKVSPWIAKGIRFSLMSVSRSYSFIARLFAHWWVSRSWRRFLYTWTEKWWSWRVKHNEVWRRWNEWNLHQANELIKIKTPFLCKSASSCAASNASNESLMKDPPKKQDFHYSTSSPCTVDYFVSSFWIKRPYKIFVTKILLTIMGLVIYRRWSSNILAPDIDPLHFIWSWSSSK